MALFVSGLRQLAREMNILKQGKLPPLISFLMSMVILILSFIAAFLYLLPFLVAVLHLNFVLALVLAILAFALLNVILGEIAAVVVNMMSKKKQ